MASTENRRFTFTCVLIHLSFRIYLCSNSPVVSHSPVLKFTFARMGGAANDSLHNDTAARRSHVVDELECVEQTLATRRAQLQETNQQLVELQAKLETIQAEVSSCIISMFLLQSTYNNNNSKKFNSNTNLHKVTS